MLNYSKEEKLLIDIYRAVYWEIGVNIDELIESGETKKEGWFLNYCLSALRQKEILEDMLKGQKLTKLKRQVIRNSYYLGCSPKSC